MQTTNISRKAIEFLNSRKNANNLIDILDLFEKEDESITQTCIADLSHIFQTIFERQEMVQKAGVKKAEIAYRSWLRELYDSTFTKLIEVFMEMASVQKQALAALMHLIALEEKNPIGNVEKPEYLEGSFPVYRLKEIVAALLSNSKRTSSQIKAFIFCVKKYDDVKFFTWNLILGTVNTHRNIPNEIFVKNFLCLFDNMLINYKNGDEIRLCQGSMAFTMDQTKIPNKIEQTWFVMMQWKLMPEIHKQMMEMLLIKIIPHMKHPLRYTDYLVAMLNEGGALSILALQAMLTLIQKFNMDYPLAYEKLYMMMNPEVFHQKYKERLFYMADMFLSSSHLPQNLVASFVKRMARLTLVAPAHDIQILLAFIGNLLIRHAGLKKMLVGSHQNPELDCDPFDMNEKDPNKTKAAESFLWEIHSLRRHYLPAISNAVTELIENPLPVVEWELGPLLDSTQDKIFEREMRKKAQEIVVNYDKPQSMQLPQGEVLLQYWTLT